MIPLRSQTLLSQILKNPSIFHRLPNPLFSFTHSLLFSSQTRKNPENYNLISDYFVKKYQFSYEVASKAASGLQHLKTPEKCDAVLSFFKKIGFSKTDLEILVTSKSAPTILCAKVDETLKPKIKTFQDVGFSDSDIVCIVTANTWMLLHSANNRITPSLLVLKNVLGSVDLVARLLKVSAWFVKYDLEKNLIPNIEFLKSCGIRLEQLTRHIFNFPRFFLIKPENLKKFVGEVDEMRFRKESKLYLYAITCISSMNEVTWKKKLELIRSLGFTQDQILQMFQRAPFAFAVSQSKIKDVVQLVSGSGIYDLSDMVQHPGVLSASLEKRLKPRFQVLDILEKRNLITKRSGFSIVYLITDKKFIERFVNPYLDELGDMSLLSRELLKKDHSGSLV